MNLTVKFPFWWLFMGLSTFLRAEKCKVIRTLIGETKLHIYTHSKAVICCEIFYLSTLINESKFSISLRLSGSNNTRISTKLPSLVYEKYMLLHVEYNLLLPFYRTEMHASVHFKHFIFFWLGFCFIRNYIFINCIK